MRLAAQAKGGYYPTPPRVVDLVAKLLYGARGRARSADTLRILDPCCGTGDALVQFAGLLQDRSTVPVETFGVELHRERAEQAAEVLDRDADLRPLRHHHRQWRLRRAPLESALRLGPGGQARRARLPDVLHPLSGRGRAAAVHSAQAAAGCLRPATCHPTTGTSGAGPSPTRSGRPSTRWSSSGSARPSRAPTPTPRSRCREWSFGEPEEFSPRPYPVYDPVVTPAGDILFATRTVDPLAAVAEARKTGLWGHPGGQGLPVARRGPAHPAPDAPAPRTPGDAGGGGVSRQPGAGGRRAAHPGQGPHDERDLCWPRRRRTPRSTGNG